MLKHLQGSAIAIGSDLEFAEFGLLPGGNHLLGAADHGAGLRSGLEFLGIVSFLAGEFVDFVAELEFGLEAAEFAHHLEHGVVVLAGVLLDAEVARVFVPIEERVEAVVFRLGEELGFGAAAAFDVPGAFEDAFEEEILEVAEGLKVFEERGFDAGEVVFHAEGDDESAGCEVVADGVLGGFGFAFLGSWAGRELGVLAVGEDLCGGCHGGFRSFRSGKWKAPERGVGFRGGRLRFEYTGALCQVFASGGACK